jgi:hypothetical protein
LRGKLFSPLPVHASTSSTPRLLAILGRRSMLRACKGSNRQRRRPLLPRALDQLLLPPRVFFITGQQAATGIEAIHPRPAEQAAIVPPRLLNPTGHNITVICCNPSSNLNSCVLC